MFQRIFFPIMSISTWEIHGKCVLDVKYIINNWHLCQQTNIVQPCHKYMYTNCFSLLLKYLNKAPNEPKHCKNVLLYVATPDVVHWAALKIRCWRISRRHQSSLVNLKKLRNWFWWLPTMNAQGSQLSFEFIEFIICTSLLWCFVLT